MSVTTAKPTIAYLAKGNIRVKAGDAPPRTVDSIYGNSIREKEIRSQQRHSWKSSGNGSPFGGPALWGKGGGMNQEVPLAITSICGGREKGGLLYSLESGSLCALLEGTQNGAEERRLWNDNRTRIRHLTVSPATGAIAFSVLHQNGTANIGVKLSGESGIQELTEGDSFDTAPRWIPGEQRRIVFQSAGIGRNREGQFLALGPFSIQQLDADAGDMTTVLADTSKDFLAPQFLADGTLLYVSRPYAAHERMHPLRTLKDFFLFPFRLAFAIFQFLNFFSSLFTGRKLTTGGGAKAREMDMKQMMIWGNLVHSRTPGHAEEEEGADLVPKSWQLIRRTASGETKTLASGVLAYDVREDGAIVYTNGNAVHILHPDGRKDTL